jgi:hypothetical protein
MPPSTFPSIITPTLLNSIRTHPGLPLHCWYFITAATLTILNRPDEIPTVYKNAIEYGPSQADSKPKQDERLEISRKMREALVKTAAVGGVPKVFEHTVLHNPLSNSWRLSIPF